MAHYLVSAVLKYGLVEELRERLARGEFEPLRPFGPTLMHSLKNARIGEDGVAAWEGADYCRPPLAEERAAVLDEYFRDIRVERVKQGEGWRKIENYPRLFPGLASS
jgi:hypothetical protein